MPTWTFSFETHSVEEYIWICWLSMVSIFEAFERRLFLSFRSYLFLYPEPEPEIWMTLNNSKLVIFCWFQSVPKVKYWNAHFQSQIFSVESSKTNFPH